MDCFVSFYGDILSSSIKHKISSIRDDQNHFADTSFNGARAISRQVEKLKRDVSVTIFPLKDEFAPDEPVLMNVTLKNDDASKQARILDWINPCSAEVAGSSSPTDMSFFDIKTLGGQAAQYMGAAIKRKAPTSKDYMKFKPGEQISCTISLDKYYQFTASSDDDDYEIKYTVTSMQLSNPSQIQGDIMMIESLETSAFTVKINARTYPTRALRDQNIRGLQTGGTTFNKCSSAQQGLIREARRQALAQATNVVNLLTSVSSWGSTARCYRYAEWFGAYSRTRHTELRTGYEAIRRMLNGTNIKFDCTCTD